VFSVLVRQGLCGCRVKSLCISGLQRRVFSFSGSILMYLKDLQRFWHLYSGKAQGGFHHTTGVKCRGLSKLAFQPGGDWGVSRSTRPRVSAGYRFRYLAAEGAPTARKVTPRKVTPATGRAMRFEVPLPRGLRRCPRLHF